MTTSTSVKTSTITDALVITALRTTPAVDFTTDKSSTFRPPNNLETSSSSTEPKDTSRSASNPQLSTTSSLSTGHTPVHSTATTDQTSRQKPTSDKATTQDRDTKTLILDLKVCTMFTASKAETLESLQKIFQQVEEMLREKHCSDCTLKIINIQMKTQKP
ncbi:salivary glue protein Sgs-3-like [Hoplias malabaricus]|uniref:salivary glue protein Sgs-3-like n=1 Tax=Hoplias malabaricus TaxID=27720 RepID=UPI003461848A